MSSAASITFDPETSGVPIDQWQAFCAEHVIVHSPQTVGGNVYYAGDVDVIYNEHALHFSTFWSGKAIPDVARIAMSAWCRWGGKISADPEVRVLLIPTSRRIVE